MNATFTADDLAEVRDECEARIDAVHAECDALLTEKDETTFTAINTWAAAWNEHACVLEDLDANLDRFEALIERIRDAKRFPAIDMEAAIEALIEAVEDLPVETAWDFGRLRPALPE